MRVLSLVSQHQPDVRLSFVKVADVSVRPFGTTYLGELQFDPRLECKNYCYLGLDLASTGIHKNLYKTRHGLECIRKFINIILQKKYTYTTVFLIFFISRQNLFRDTGVVCLKPLRSFTGTHVYNNHSFEISLKNISPL